MVNGALWMAGSLGVLLSGGFAYWEIGRYATPQVPRSLFDERKELIAYAVGLFLGIVLSIPFGLFLASVRGGTLLVALVGLGGLAGGVEVGSWAMLRTVYFGTGDAGPFYVLAGRTGASAILILTFASIALGAPSLDPLDVVALLLGSTAILGLLVAGAVLSFRRHAAGGGGGGPAASGAVTAAGFFLLGLGGLFGSLGTAVASLLIVGMTARIYLRLRGPVLSGIRPPRGPDEATGEAAPPPSPFGRTDR